MVNFSIKNRSKKISADGYVLVYLPEHPKSFNDGWYYEHRVVLEQYYNRALKDWETVHHINGDKTDNCIDNLFLCTRNQHLKAHN